MSHPTRRFFPFHLWQFVIPAFAILILAQCSSPSPTDPSFVWVWKPGPRAVVMAKEDNLNEGKAIGSPSVILDGDEYRMVYAQGGKDDRGRIGMATSTDGTTWIKFQGGGSVLVPGPPSVWDSWFLDTPALVKKSGAYWLYYYGSRSNGTPGASIGLAVGTDGVQFTRVGSSPVLVPGAPDQWDGNWVESPVVLGGPDGFKMFYTGVDRSWRVRVGLATSSDGTNWTKYPGNPVMGAGPDGAWDSFGTAVPAVLQKNQTYQMFYCSQTLLESALGIRAPKIGYAYSTDGKSWTRFIGNPILTAWDTWLQPDGPYNPTALFDEHTHRYMLWYETGTGFGLVTADAIPGI